ncbi:restriction endonuclease subunit S [Aeromonas veronii]|uniref:restriction endonuclease subunit S n=1 Tax=Aeromonas veronii TaxID=654 RepID=UPI002B468D4D|nr:restriction endonuclease subunit S [Aeromonas veronii]
MVPNGWSRSQIGEIANVQVGRDLIEDRYSEIESERYKYPVYSNTVENRGLYGFYDFPEYPGNAVTVVGRGVGLGTAFARYENSAFGAIGRLLVLTPKINSFDVGFLADYINFSLIIHNESGGIPQLPGASLSKYLVTLPPLPEQQKIAKILSTWDSAISTTEQLLFNSQQQKKALMQQLLTGQKRLLDNNGVRFNDSWKQIPLSEVIQSLDSGVSVNSVDDEVFSEYFILKTSCVTSGYFNCFEKKKVIDVNEVKRLKEPLLDDSILISRMNTPLLVGANAYVEFAPENTFLPDRLWQVKIRDDRVLMRWLGFWFSSPKTRVALSDLASGTSGSMKNIAKVSVLGMGIKLPPLQEQKKIAAVLSTADQEVTALQQKLAALKQEKQALMQQLLTGKRRVKVEEAA